SGQFGCGSMSSMTYIPVGFSNSSASSSKRYLPDHVSAKMKSKCCPRTERRKSSPSAHTTVSRGSPPRCFFRMDKRLLSLSTVVRRERASIPSSSQAVDRPVPEPSSRKRADGFEAARVRNKEHVRGSDAMLKPDARVSAQIAAMTSGSRRLARSFIGAPASHDPGSRSSPARSAGVHALAGLHFGNERPVFRRQVPMATPKRPIAAEAAAEDRAALRPTWRSDEEAFQHALRDPAEVHQERQVDVDQRVRARKALPRQLDRPVAIDDPRLTLQDLRVRLHELVVRDRGSAGPELHHVHDV